MCNKLLVQQLSIKFQFQTHNFQTIIYVAKFFKQLSINCQFFFAPNYNFKQYIYMNQFFNQLSNNCLQKFWHHSNYKQYFLLHTLSINYQSIRHLKVYHQTNSNQYFLFHHIFGQLSINYLLYILLSNKHQTIVEPDRKFQ